MKHKHLSEYVAHLGSLVLGKTDGRDFAVRNVTNDSRKIGKDDIFVAVKGASSDGHEFVGRALAAGAAVIVHEKDIDTSAPRAIFIRVKKSYPAYAAICETFFDYPARNLKLAGITGTNGKTTNAYLLHSILSDSSLKTGLISTVCRRTGKKTIMSERTTPEAYELQETFREMADSGCTHAAMEVSSHALDQNRTGSAKFAGVLFTNLTGDHLDYHKDMESYFSAKKILFDNHTDESSAAAINTDDHYGKMLAEGAKNMRLFSFGKTPEAKCRMKNLVLGEHETVVEVSLGGKKYILTTPLLGEYNGYNVTGAFALACGLGLEPVKIIESIAKGVNVPGRLEKVPNTKGINIIVDYAHTDDALGRVLTALRPVTRGKLICVFGCGGDRDRSKRPRMGALSAKLADFSIVTSDNPRTEKPEEIIKEIIAGITPSAKFKNIPDRRLAICEAIKYAHPGDTVLLAGKGHETYQEINGVKHPFDDREEAEKACRL